MGHRSIDEAIKHSQVVQFNEWVESAPDGFEKQHRVALQARHNEQLQEILKMKSSTDTNTVENLEAAMDLFKNLDKNGDGSIKHKDLLMVLNRLDKDQWSEDRLLRLLKAGEINKDGKVNLSEFLQYLFGPQLAL